MRKWLMALFLLLITSIGIVGYMNVLDSEETDTEVTIPTNSIQVTN